MSHRTGRVTDAGQAPRAEPKWWQRVDVLCFFAFILALIAVLHLQDFTLAAITKFAGAPATASTPGDPILRGIQPPEVIR